MECSMENGFERGQMQENQLRGHCKRTDLRADRVDKRKLW